MITIFDANASVPSVGNASLNRPIPASPDNIRVAAFGLYVPEDSNQVFLNGTLGITTQILNPTLLIQVFRDTQVIYTLKTALVVDVGQSQSISFTAVDMNAPVGYHSYAFNVSIVNGTMGLNSGTVTGPVAFTGLSLSTN